MPRREGAGRKLAKIDMAELEKLCGLQCTEEEIGAWFGVARETICRRRKGSKAFAECMAHGYAKGRISVRRQQMKLLEGGNATMGIWLGKQLLGQRDQIDQQVSVTVSTIASVVRDRRVKRTALEKA